MYLQVAKLACIVEKTRDKNFSVLAGSAGYLLPSLFMGKYNYHSNEVPNPILYVYCIGM